MFAEQVAERKDKIGELRKSLVDQGVRYAHVIYPDIAGQLRIKTEPLAKALCETGETLNAVLAGLCAGDGEPVGDPCWFIPSSSTENGFPNIPALIDPDSVRVLSWRPETASVFLNVFEIDQRPWVADLRAMISALEARLARIGLSAKFAFEYEVGIFHADSALISEGRFSELKPFGYRPTNYDVCKAAGLEELTEEFFGSIEKRVGYAAT